MWRLALAFVAATLLLAAWHVSTLPVYVHPTNPIPTPTAVEEGNMTSGMPVTPFVPSRPRLTPSVTSEELYHE